MVTLSEKKCVHDAHLIKGNTDPCIMHAMVGSMPTPGADIADSLGILLRRSSRAHLYTQLTAGLDDALDEAAWTGTAPGPRPSWPPTSAWTGRWSAGTPAAWPPPG
jgi:hypothetical protein